MLPLDSEGHVLVEEALLQAIGEKEIVKKVLDVFGNNVFGRAAEHIKVRAKVPLDVAQKIFELGALVAAYYIGEYIPKKGVVDAIVLEQLGILHREKGVAKTDIEYFNKLCFQPPDDVIQGVIDYYKQVLLFFYPPKAVLRAVQTARKTNFMKLLLFGVTGEYGKNERLVLERATELLKRTPLGQLALQKIGKG